MTGQLSKNRHVTNNPVVSVNRIIRRDHLVVKLQTGKMVSPHCCVKLRNQLEPPCTDPYARWCGRGRRVTVAPMPIWSATRTPALDRTAMLIE
jgi:hypothetical protein